MNSNIPRFNNLKALIVEDNPINRKMLKHTLKNVGIISDIAENGQIGFNMAKQNQYDIIFMDIQMPIMNGVEATKAIINYEKENKIPHTPIVAVTANALKGDRERYMSEGMDEYVPKPVNLQNFFSVLKKILAHKDISDQKRVLLFKETKIEARILEEIVKQLNYEVKSVRDIDEFLDVNLKNFDIVLTDRVTSNNTYFKIIEKIESAKIPSILFIDSDIEVSSKDKRVFSMIKNKFTNYKDMENSLRELI